MIHFATTNFFLEGDPGVRGLLKVPAETVQPIIQRLKRELLACEAGQAFTTQISFDNVVGPVFLACQRVGDTAVIAKWVRNVDRLDGLSLYLSGVDRQEDERAIQTVETAWPQPGYPALYDEIRGIARPVAVHITMTRRAARDPLFFVSQACLTGAVGLLLGTGEER